MSNRLSIAATFPPKREMTEETIHMKAIVVTDQAAGTAGMKLVERPEPQAATNEGLSVGQRVFGLSDSYRGGTLAEYVAVEARNLAPLPGDVDFTVGASVAMPGLTAWQGLFQ